MFLSIAHYALFVVFGSLVIHVAYLRCVFPALKVSEVSVAPDIGELEPMLTRRAYFASRVRHNASLARSSGVRPLLSDGADAIDYFAVELLKVDLEIKRWRSEGHHETSAGACIVTFRSTADAAHYLQTFREAHRMHLVNSLRSRYALPAGSPPKSARGGFDETTSRPRLAVPMLAADFDPESAVRAATANDGRDGVDGAGSGGEFDGAKHNILSWAVERAPSV